MTRAENRAYDRRAKARARRRLEAMERAITIGPEPTRKPSPKSVGYVATTRKPCRCETIWGGTTLKGLGVKGKYRRTRQEHIQNDKEKRDGKA
jgi:hypothetical protein